MAIQHQIKRQLSGKIPEISALIGQKPQATRTALARQLCERHGFRDAGGRLQLSTCLKALRDFDAAGLIDLPEARRAHNSARRSPRRLDAAPPEPEGLPSSVENIADLRLELVEDAEKTRIWNELIIREHPLGRRRLVGRQVRYLIVSEHGILGAAGFAAAALKLRARDEWLGWDEQTRREELDKIVCLSRFLIRPCIQCANLASRVLSMLAKALPGDFEARYGYRPWLLESFVDSAEHAGSSYKAAGWKCVGQTAGRGRQDREHKAGETPKDIYLLALGKELEARGLGEANAPQPLEAGEGLDEQNWAANELGGARLGDERLTRRLLSIAQSKGRNPGTPFLQTIDGDRAAAIGYYRFIDAPESSRIDMENILAPHRQRTLGRIKAQKRVLCIHDTTDLNYSTLVACEGLGVIGKNQTKAESRGLSLHTSYVVGAGQGVPLGIWHWHCRSPRIEAEHKGKDSRAVPLEEKQTARRVENLKKCMLRREELGATQVIHVMDREADFFELFHHWSQLPGNDELIVRVRQNRSLLGPSERKKNKGGAEQTEQKEQTKLFEWMLYTSIPIESLQDAAEIIGFYAKRWRIEDWHRILKTCCRVEEPAHRDAQCLKRLVAINMVIAWRIHLMTLLGREVPELPVEVLFSDLEIQVMAQYCRSHQLAEPSNLGEAVLLVAKLGGYLGRKNDGPPGAEILWRGSRKLSTWCEFAAFSAPPA